MDLVDNLPNRSLYRYIPLRDFVPLNMFLNIHSYIVQNKDESKSFGSKSSSFESINSDIQSQIDSPKGTENEHSIKQNESFLQLNEIKIYNFDLELIGDSKIINFPCLILFHIKSGKILLKQSICERQTLFNFETLINCHSFDLRDNSWIISNETNAEYSIGECIIIICGISWNIHSNSTLNSFKRSVWEWIKDRNELHIHERNLHIQWNQYNAVHEIPTIILYDASKERFIFEYKPINDKQTSINIQSSLENDSHLLLDSDNDDNNSKSPKLSKSNSQRAIESIFKSEIIDPQKSVTLTYECVIENSKRNYRMILEENESLHETVETLKERILILQSQLQVERDEHTITSNHLKDAEDKLIYLTDSKEELEQIRDQVRLESEGGLESIKKKLAISLHNHIVSKSRTFRSNFESRAQYYNKNITDKQINQVELRYKDYLRLLISRYAACLEILTGKEIPSTNLVGHVGYGTEKDITKALIKGIEYESKLCQAIQDFTGPLENYISLKHNSSQLIKVNKDISQQKKKLSNRSSSIGSIRTDSIRSSNTSRVQTPQSPVPENAISQEAFPSFYGSTNSAISDVLGNFTPKSPSNLTDSPQSPSFEGTFQRTNSFGKIGGQTTPRSKSRLSIGAINTEAPIGLSTKQVSPSKNESNSEISPQTISTQLLLSTQESSHQNKKILDLERKLESKDEIIASLTQVVSAQQQQIMTLLKQASQLQE